MDTKRGKKTEAALNGLVDNFEEELEEYLINFEDHLLLFLSLDPKQQESIARLLKEDELDIVHNVMINELCERKLQQLREMFAEEEEKTPRIIN